MRLVLASASPRRREILETLGVAFEVAPSDVDEAWVSGESAAAAATRLATAKATDVSARRGDDAWVLGSDTVVVVERELLAKPVDEADARRMIRRLAGGWHEVVTGIALARSGRVVDLRAVTTKVRFVAMTDDRVERYVATGEGADKAGAYAIQGVGAGLVDRIEGSYSNVVGLPAAETVALLEAHGALEAWP